MATTMIDVTLDETWQNIYTLTGITPATALVLQNKSSEHMLVLVAAEEPAVSSVDGWSVASGESVDISAGDDIWVKGDGPIVVQAATA